MQDEVLLVYDQECPACDNYCRFVRLKASVGNLTLVNARDAHPVMEEITAAGLDIDEGMVVKAGGQLYYGADAIHVLALMSSRFGWFNRLNFLVFRSATVAGFLYPLLRICRGWLLKLLRKTRINNLGIEGRDRF